MNIEIAEGYSRLDEIRLLFDEYTASLGIDLTYQNYAQEVAGLPGKYAGPGGRLYIACGDGAAAGCVGLRRLDAQRCEMKRLYVRDRFRGRRIGEMLVRRVVQEAKAMGYRAVVLDTLPTMERACRLYQKLGFVETGPYYESPVKDTRFLSLVLY